MSWIINFDHRLFLIINHWSHPDWLNKLALIFSAVGGSGVLIWLVLGLWLFFREEEENHRFVGPFITAAVASTVIANYILKPIVERLRPTPEMGALIISPATGTFSFPSGHATFAFAMATVLAAQEPRWKFWFYLLAVIISLSRIYLGVHYPLDVIVGALLGWGIGWASLKLFTLRQAAKKARKRGAGRHRKG